MDKFDEELKALLENARARNAPFNEVEAEVFILHTKHGRKVPPPITGTVQIHEPEDSSSGG